MEIKPSCVYIDCRATSKKDAIEEVGKLLAENGNIQKDYIGSMHGREQVANTYLGNGIAIPHGMEKDRDYINETGIAVIQIRDGIEWNPGEKVYLVFGIAAKSDEHLGILANLTGLVNDPDTLKKLSKTEDKKDIINCLSETKNKSEADSKPYELKKGEKCVEVPVSEKTGLHARPASVFIDLARKFKADVKIQRIDNNEIVNADSMASILSLKVANGDTIRIIASGEEADIALKELNDAVLNGLVEEDEEDIPGSAEYEWDPGVVKKVFEGTAASTGIAIGKIRVLKKAQFDIEKEAVDPKSEIVELLLSIRNAKQELEILVDEVAERAGEGKAVIFKAHSEFLNDPEIVNNAKKLISEGFTAAWSWNEAINKKATETRKLEDPVLSARAIDILDVGNRVLRLLLEAEENSKKNLKTFYEKNTILLADELTPSDTVSLDPATINGICTVGGGVLSHSAIISRSFGIPAVVGIGKELLDIQDGEAAIIDGSAGKLFISPDKKGLNNAQEVIYKQNELKNIEKSQRFKPAVTQDGERIEVAANIGASGEAAMAVEAGSEGIGLLRTEFLFLERSKPPTEEEQFSAYSEIVKNLAGLPLTLRTLDIGGDKQISYINLSNEENPFLGVRGIRLCFNNEELFRTQLKAVLRAAEDGPVRIMFPMISLVKEIKKAKEIVEEIREEVDGPETEIGIMIEVPSAALMAENFADYVDFFSIGTNDLTQYVLAMDRGNTELAKQADGLNPAILKMIDMTVKAAHSKNKWVGVCGDLAGDPVAAVVLSGLGVDELSVSIPSVPKIKMKIRNIKMSDAKEYAEKALACETSEEVRILIKGI